MRHTFPEQTRKSRPPSTFLITFTTFSSSSGGLESFKGERTCQTICIPLID